MPEKEFKDMTISELLDAQQNNFVKATMRAFIEGFKSSTRSFNWENVQIDIRLSDYTIEDFFEDMKHKFKKLCSINE